MSDHVKRNLLLVAAALAAITVTWWVMRAPVDAARVNEAQSETSVDSAGSIGDPVVRAVRPADSASPEDESAAGFREYVDAKYRYLFSDGSGAIEHGGALDAALLAREQLVARINTAKQSADPEEKSSLPKLQAQLAEADHEIVTLLPAGALEAFEVLKDADIERFQVEDYAEGISNVVPLSDANKRAVLMAKLVHRQRFRRVLEDSGLMSGQLNAAERKAAFTEVSRALKASQDAYLQEVRQYLYDEEQYILLSSYEGTEYTEELAKLRSIAYGE